MKQFVEPLLYEFLAIILSILFIHVQFQSPNSPARGCGTRERRKAKFGGLLPCLFQNIKIAFVKIRKPS